MQPLYITRAGVVGTLVALAVAAVCVRLGVWQLDRLEERRAHNAVVAERMRAEPVAIDDADADTAGLIHRTVVLDGRYDNVRSVVLPGRSHRGRTGAHLVTPLRLDDGGAVLVNRGWIPSIDPASLDLAPYDVEGRVRLRAVLSSFPADLGGRTDDGSDAATAAATPGGTNGAGGAGGPDARRPSVYYRLDPARIGAGLPYPIFNAYARVISTGTADAGPPHPLPPPALDDGPHVSYAVQWFSFAAIALIGWATLALRRGELGRRARSADDR